jgi:hypothetical protein
MDIKAVAMALGYPSIFSKSSEDAASNLFRLIVNQECGYDEGAHYWHKTVSDLLDGEHDLLELNACGAKLTADQWRRALQLLYTDLSVFIDNASD